jgi:hypothetical protein
MRQTSDLTPDLPNLHGLVPQPHVFRASIVLPHAQTELAVIVLWAGVIAAALYQSLMLGTLRYKWCQRLLPFALAFIGPGAVMAISVLQFARESHHHVSTDQPQALDLAQAWVIRNPLVFGLIGAAMIGLALRFSRRRFVRQEVLS